MRLLGRSDVGILFHRGNFVSQFFVCGRELLQLHDRAYHGDVDTAGADGLAPTLTYAKGRG